MAGSAMIRSELVGSSAMTVNLLPGSPASARGRSVTRGRQLRHAAGHRSAREPVPGPWARRRRALELLRQLGRVDVHTRTTCTLLLERAGMSTSAM